MTDRILILCTGQLSNCPRVLKEATTLGNVGYKVTVIGMRSLAALDKSDLSIQQGTPFGYVQIDLIGANKYSLSHIRGLTRRAKIKGANKLKQHLGWESAEALGPAAELLRMARGVSADLTITHNEAAHWVGLQLLAEGRVVAADFEDWNSEDLPPSTRGLRPINLLKRNEQELLRRAAYTSTTSNALADGLHGCYGGRRPIVITNSFPLPSIAPRPSPTDKPPSFFWFSQTLGPNRGLEPFLKAYALLNRPSRLTLLGQVSSDYKASLLGLLPGSLRHQLSFHPLVPTRELQGVISQHDIGLALEQNLILNRDLTITNKILQYLESGLAVVATPTKGQLEVLSHAPDAGIILSQLEDQWATAAALDNLLADVSRLRKQQQTARQLAVAHYCWEREAPKLLHAVESALAKRNLPGS